MKNEEKVVIDQPEIFVFTGTEKFAKKQYKRQEEKEKKLIKVVKRPTPYVGQRQQSHDEDSDSQTISQESDGEQQVFLKKQEESAYLDAITDSQALESKQTIYEAADSALKIEGG